MVAPTLTQILIVASGFGVVGLYVWIVHLIVSSSERADPNARPTSRPAH